MYKLGWFGAVRGHSNKVIGNVSVRQNANNFLFNFNSYYASILYRFQDIASHCRKSPIFTFPPYIWHITTHTALAESRAVEMTEFQ